MFSKALLKATYINGKPGRLTQEHAKAEHHRFKSNFLFKQVEIPQNHYTSRLIQHFFILHAIEKKLQELSEAAKSELNPFFALSYLEHLWRTAKIKNDLNQLGLKADTIPETEATPSTAQYLKQIEGLAPKILLAHFLLHVAGFLHGGRIICTKYIEPHNRLGLYQISTHQYDFSATMSKSAPALFHELMQEVDKITLNENEFNEIVDQCKSIYATMSSIYDDLTIMPTHQSQRALSTLALLGVSMMILAWIFNQYPCLFNSKCSIAYQT